MSSDFSFNDDFNETFAEDGENAFTVLDSIIFLVDGTEQMFEKDYFTKCLEVYRNVIRQKCARNKKDKVGLIIYGTKESNCEIENLMTLQKFETVTVDSLKNISNILKENVSKYRMMSSGSKYSLYDALFYAYQQTKSFKTNSKKRNIIFLCTCNDNPCQDKSDERRRVQYLVATFKNSDTKLWVAGLPNVWNDELYYRDLQIISGTFTNDDYRRIHLKDIEQQVINPSRSIGKLTWKISSQIAIDVNLMSLIGTPTYPSKVKLQKEDNEILEDRHVLRQDNIDDRESTELMEESRMENKIISDEHLVYCKNFGNKDVSFKPVEHKRFQNMGLQSGIEILAFETIQCDPVHHITHPYFVTYTPNSSYESKIFFMALISRCAEKKVMAICKVVTKMNVFICAMIPSEDDGGFYMYKIPSNDKVRDLNNLLQSFIYNSENSCEVSEQAVHVFKKLMDAYEEDFDIKLFTNPKLGKCIAHIEALALDEKLGELPPDRTLPPQITSNVQDLKNALISLLDLQQGASTKRRLNEADKSSQKKTKLDIVALAEKNMLHKATVPELRAYLNSVNQGYAGTKSELIKNIKKYLGK